MSENNNTDNLTAITETLILHSRILEAAMQYNPTFASLFETTELHNLQTTRHNLQQHLNK